jgi:hypothetical protein
MEAEDWLKGVEKNLVIAQCMDHVKVLSAAHKLYERQLTCGDVLQHPCEHQHHHVEQLQGSFSYSLCASWHHEVEEEGIHRPITRQYDSE